MLTYEQIIERIWNDDVTGFHSASTCGKLTRNFQVNDVIIDLQEMLVFNFSEKDLILQVKNRTNHFIAGDYRLLRRAFEDVLVNCIRHSPPKEKIEVFIHESEGFIETMIRDRRGSKASIQTFD